MAQIVSGKFIASTAAINIECGFVPDYVNLISALGSTELEFEYYKILADLEVAGRYGFTLTTSGVPGPASSGSGIVAYDAKEFKALLPAPNGNGDKPVSIYGSFAEAKAAGLNPTQRSTSVFGSVIRPTIKNGFLYECSINGGVMTALTEPTTWPTALGQTVSDGSNTWICREEKLKWVGVKGFTLEASICSDGELWVFKAEKHDRVEDMGDADTEKPLQFKING